GRGQVALEAFQRVTGTKLRGALKGKEPGELGWRPGRQKLGGPIVAGECHEASDGLLGDRQKQLGFGDQRSASQEYRDPIVERWRACFYCSRFVVGQAG